MAEKMVDRRGFLKAAAVAGAGASLLAAARKAAAEESRAQSAYRWAMVIDVARCRGCGYCTLACRAHNDVPPWISWNRIVRCEDGEHFLPRPCMHCENAPCVEVCPVKATYRRADGVVMMDYERCIGCRYCQVACPYLARAFNWKPFTSDNPAVPAWGQPEVPRRPRGVVEKCSFCVQRIDRGLALGLQPGVDQEATPACVVACPVEARFFGDLNDPQSTVSQLLRQHPYYRLRDDLGTEPRVYYLRAPHGEGA